MRGDLGSLYIHKCRSMRLTPNPKYAARLAVVDATSIRALDLSKMPVDATIRLVLEVAIVASGVHTVDLSNASLSDKHISAIAPLIIDLPRLRVLKLEHNPDITVQSASALKAIASECRALTELGLRGTRLPDHDVENLYDTVEQRRVNNTSTLSTPTGPTHRPGSQHTPRQRQRDGQDVNGYHHNQQEQQKHQWPRWELANQDMPSNEPVQAPQPAQLPAEKKQFGVASVAAAAAAAAGLDVARQFEKGSGRSTAGMTQESGAMAKALGGVLTRYRKGEQEIPEDADLFDLHRQQQARADSNEAGTSSGAPRRLSSGSTIEHPTSFAKQHPSAAGYFGGATLSATGSYAGSSVFGGTANENEDILAATGLFGASSVLHKLKQMDTLAHDTLAKAKRDGVVNESMGAVVEQALTNVQQNAAAALKQGRDASTGDNGDDEIVDSDTDVVELEQRRQLRTMASERRQAETRLFTALAPLALLFINIGIEGLIVLSWRRPVVTVCALLGIASIIIWSFVSVLSQLTMCAALLRVSYLHSTSLYSFGGRATRIAGAARATLSGGKQDRSSARVSVETDGTNFGVFASSVSSQSEWTQFDDLMSRAVALRDALRDPATAAEASRRLWTHVLLRARFLGILVTKIVHLWDLHPRSRWNTLLVVALAVACHMWFVDLVTIGIVVMTVAPFVYVPVVLCRPRTTPSNMASLESSPLQSPRGRLSARDGSTPRPKQQQHHIGSRCAGQHHNAGPPDGMCLCATPTKCVDTTFIPPTGHGSFAPTHFWVILSIVAPMTTMAGDRLGDSNSARRRPTATRHVTTVAEGPPVPVDMMHSPSGWHSQVSLSNGTAARSGMFANSSVHVDLHGVGWLRSHGTPRVPNLLDATVDVFAAPMPSEERVTPRQPICIEYVGRGSFAVSRTEVENLIYTVGQQQSDSDTITHTTYVALRPCTLRDCRAAEAQGLLPQCLTEPSVIVSDADSPLAARSVSVVPSSTMSVGAVAVQLQLLSHGSHSRGE